MPYADPEKRKAFSRAANARLKEERRLNRLQNPLVAHNFVDLTGQQFGMLVVIRRAESDKNGCARWFCECTCGTGTKIVKTEKLRNGHANSCGCMRGSKTVIRYNLPLGRCPRNDVLRSYKTNAERRGFVWSISDEEFDVLTQQNCHYCGIEPHRTRKTSRNGSFTYNGIDRIDNDLGYIPGNVVSSCYDCNRAKGNKLYDDWKNWLRRIIEHNLDWYLGHKSDIVDGSDIQSKEIDVIPAFHESMLQMISDADLQALDRMLVETPVQCVTPIAIDTARVFITTLDDKSLDVLVVGPTTHGGVSLSWRCDDVDIEDYDEGISACFLIITAEGKLSFF